MDTGVGDGEKGRRVHPSERSRADPFVDQASVAALLSTLPMFTEALLSWPCVRPTTPLDVLYDSPPSLCSSSHSLYPCLATGFVNFRASQSRHPFYSAHHPLLKASPQWPPPRMLSMLAAIMPHPSPPPLHRSGVFCAENGMLPHSEIAPPASKARFSIHRLLFRGGSTSASRLSLARYDGEGKEQRRGEPPMALAHSFKGGYTRKLSNRTREPQRTRVLFASGPRLPMHL